MRTTFLKAPVGSFQLSLTLAGRREEKQCSKEDREYVTSPEDSSVVIKEAGRHCDVFQRRRLVITPIVCITLFFFHFWTEIWSHRVLMFLPDENPTYLNPSSCFGQSTVFY
ncbi:hypothetical protein CEXT_88951 [Caerostris extrusa]|uniref:Uncharacterized protein n=1 Tax=Caerostris extrusa TaxID=172846 RepID=A0AAV4TQP4_CAEEX|nr:hypothetical protein CEXT_88951 [Caerostris extrusa]